MLASKPQRKEESLEKYLIEHCSPTLASLKTANLFNLDKRRITDFYGDILRLNTILNSKGIEVRVVKEDDERALVYVYRKSMLINDWKNEDVKKLAKERGYDLSSIDKSLEVLSNKLMSKDEFPHEIGIFLGYPIGDVIGFIENKGKNCKCIGCWKVYCDECKAQSMFDKFNKCRAVYKQLWKRGKAVTQLTVAA